jgi:hypothetical protein
MTFKAKEKEMKLQPDCKDFKPFLFDKEHCKLTNKCANAGKEYEIDCFLKHPNLCTGISSEKYNKWLKKKYLG